MKIRGDNKIIFFGMIVVIILLIIAIRTVISNKKIDTSKLSDEEFSTYINDKTESIIKKDLSKLGERDRMEYYVSTFIKSIENKQYETAYEMLYDGFKTNYFPTFDEFKSYVESKFPSLVSIEYDNIERNGDIYILWTKFSDALGSKDDLKDINFVVKEYDLNDFKLSFSVEL